MNLLKYLTVSICAMLLLGCQVKPTPIAYGHDGCHFCKMTIVDKIHAAEIVTTKGKVYTFDATECMVHFMDDFEAADVALFLTNDYNQPEALIDATQATYLISANIPSPMGANLSAFNSRNEAEIVQADKGGVLYSWEALLVHLTD